MARPIRRQQHEIDPNFSIPDDSDEFRYSEPPNEFQEFEEDLVEDAELPAPVITSSRQKELALNDLEHVIRLTIFHTDIEGAVEYEYLVRLKAPPQGATENSA